MRAPHRSALGLLAVLSLAACTQDGGNVDTTCVDSTGCRSDALCVQARCYATEGADHDGDGIPSHLEDVLGTDRDRADTDDDGLDDGVELIYRPRDRVAEAPDSDGDGQPDALESVTKDADGDGVPDQADRCNDDPGCPGRRDELCNDLDDDDDGRVDEAFPDKGLPCTLGEGACAADGTVICSPDGKELWCDATPGEAAAETCNDLDDDCDGATDEDFPTLGEACSAGEGPCRVDGVLACDDTGAVACDAVARRAEGETCNGVDDDCDGTVDEGFPALGVPCSVGMGLCARDGVGVCGRGRRRRAVRRAAGRAGRRAVQRRGRRLRRHHRRGLRVGGGLRRGRAALPLRRRVDLRGRRRPEV